jgi:hypothetical protein
LKKLGDYVERYKIETRDWRIGDMVKVIGYDITGLPTHTYGIIMSPGDEEQQRIFPCYNVYLFGAGGIESVEAYNLEIISSA